MKPSKELEKPAGKFKNPPRNSSYPVINLLFTGAVTKVTSCFTGNWRTVNRATSNFLIYPSDLLVHVNFANGRKNCELTGKLGQQKNTQVSFPGKIFMPNTANLFESNVFLLNLYWQVNFLKVHQYNMMEL